MDNPRIIHAPMNGRRYSVTAPITQYDYGYLLLPEGEELPTTYEIDFSNDEKNGTSLPVYGDSEGAEVPEELIRTGKDVFAFYYKIGDGYGKTEHTWRIPNHCRPSRDGETPTPSQQSSIDQLIVRSNEAVESAEQSAEDASASAQSAQTYAEQAEISASTAQNYASASEIYANTAEVHADRASASATASAQSASQSAQIKSDVEDMVEDAQASADASAQSAQASANSAIQASLSESEAERAKGNAQTYASQAQTSANTASSKAQDASGYAQTASTKATEASQSASQALTYKTDAEQAKTASQTAQGLAESARDSAVSAQESAENARDEAQALVDGISGKVDQIDQNTADIASLEDDVYDIESEIFEKIEDESVYNINFLRRIDTNGAYITASSGKYCVTDRFDISGHLKVDITAKSGYRLNLFFYSSCTGNAQDCYTGTTGYQTAHHLDGADLKCVGIVISRLDEAVIDTTLTSSDFFVIEFVESKIDVLEEDRYKPYVTDSASGSIASFPDGADGIPLKSLVVNIDPVQDLSSGDPSPENLCPISGWEGMTVNATGKNIVDISRFATEYPNYCSFSNGVLTVTSNSALYSRGINVDIPQGSVLNWTITNGTSVNARLRIVYEDGTVRSHSSPIPLTVSKRITALRFDWGTGGTFTVSNFQAELGSSATPYEPYTGQTIPISWQSEAGTVYGGSLDVLSGVLTVTHGYIASYAGETLPSTWISDRDVYASGTTPTTGAQVVYKLSEPQTYQLTPHEVASLLGQNNIFADTGDTEVEYRADTKLYIEKLTQPEEDDMIADSAITEGQFFMIGNSLYKALANIASGATITVGTNAQMVSLSDALNLVNA